MLDSIFIKFEILFLHNIAKHFKFGDTKRAVSEKLNRVGKLNKIL